MLTPPSTSWSSFGRDLVGRRELFRESVVGGRIHSGRRSRLISDDCERLESIGRLEQLLAVDMCVAGDGREVGVTEVLGNEPRVAELLAEPGRRSMAERVRGDVLLQSGALRGAPDDVGEDRLLQSSALESAEDRVGWPGAMGLGQPLQLTRETRGDWLPSCLVAFPRADEQRRLGAVELEVAYPADAAESFSEDLGDRRLDPRPGSS